MEAAVPRKPRALRSGDAVSLIAPSGAASDADRAARAADALRDLGFRVKPGPSFAKSYGYLAGSDAERAADLVAAFSDPETRGVVCLKGGYGTPRILDRIDYRAVAAGLKPFAGYSDITGLHLAFRAECPMVTFHAPMPSSDMLPAFHADSMASLMRALTSTEPLGAVRNPDGSALAALNGGRAEGELIGGNLSLVAALMGTPWEIDTRGKILFLEDIDEAPYRIDRMLNQLRLAGKFRDCEGIVLGAWTRCEPAAGKASLTIDQVFEDHLAGCGKPVVRGLQAGHCEPTLTLPFGVRCSLDADSGRLEFLEAALLT